MVSFWAIVPPWARTPNAPLFSNVVFPHFIKQAQATMTKQASNDALSAAANERTTLNGTAPPTRQRRILPPTMSSPTSVDFLPRRLESIAVSPVRKKKRIKAIPPPSHSTPVPETATSPIDDEPNLQNLPSVLIAKVLVFLVPNISHPVKSECGLINLAQVSKRYRALALDDVALRARKGA